MSDTNETKKPRFQRLANITRDDNAFGLMTAAWAGATCIAIYATVKLTQTEAELKDLIAATGALAYTMEEKGLLEEFIANIEKIKTRVP